MTSTTLSRFSERANSALRSQDPVLFGLLEEELDRQHNTLAMVASCSVTDISVLACEGSILGNVTAEGYPGQRYHAGCAVVDRIETLAVERACQTFGARYANVQPLTASIANQIVIASLIQPGDTRLGMHLDSGGHVSHGAKVNSAGRHFNAVSYGVDADGSINLSTVRAIARDAKPRLIIVGTTAYPRILDFEGFRAIADDVGAYLLADITHIAGLVAGGVHPSPIDFAHVTTLCTHKQLFGPRGGLILSGKDHHLRLDANGTTLSDRLDKGVFPLYQGAPLVNKIAAKARALARAGNQEFQDLARRILVLSRAIAATLQNRGVKVMFGGTDNHMVVVDTLTSFGVTGIVAQRALEECGIVINKNRIVGDKKPVTIASGIRLGTNSAAARGMTAEAMEIFCDTLVDLLRSVEPIGDRDYRLATEARERAIAVVTNLCSRFPLPGYAHESGVEP